MFQVASNKAKCVYRKWHSKLKLQLEGGQLQASRTSHGGVDFDARLVMGCMWSTVEGGV